MQSADTRQTARAIARAGLAAPKALLGHPIHVASVPVIAIYAATALPRHARLLYQALWLLLRRFNRDERSFWLYQTDADLAQHTACSPDSLGRARHALRHANLCYITTKQGLHGPTWYGLRFPLEYPDRQPPWVINLYADEIAANGLPPSPITALCDLSRIACPPTAHKLLLELGQVATGRLDTRRRYALQILEVSPWLYAQLAWAAPDIYRPASPPSSQIPFAL